MSQVTVIRSLPQIPAVYCLFGGRGKRRYAAYVGLAESLRGRVLHHLVLRNSSVTTGAAAVSLNPALVTEIDWWTREDFSDRVILEAAELIAFEVLEPALRSRGAVTAAAKSLADSSEFSVAMSAVFRGPPTGHETFADAEQIHNRLDDLEKRVQILEGRLSSGQKP